jgi:anti-sigma B factor antagonist
MSEVQPNISVSYEKNATIITITKEKILEEKDIQHLWESILSVLEQNEAVNLVLDFSNVRFLSSTVLGLLIRLSKKVYENDGTLKLCNIDRKIYEIFKITRLTKIFEICKDIDSALEAIPEGGQ